MALLLCTLVAPAAAQINTEAMRVGADEPGWSGFLSLALVARQGNSDLLLAAPGFRLQHAKLTDEEHELGPYTRNLFFWIADYSYAEQNEERSVNAGFTHLRWTRMVKRRIGYEAFLQNEFDEFTALDLRYLVGGGGRFGVLLAPHSEIYLGTGLMYENERRDVPLDGPDDPRATSVRWTNYFTVKWNDRSERIFFSNIAYVQPSIEEFNDLRVLDEASFEVEITDRLTFGLSLLLRYDSEPPIGIRETDWRLRNVFRYEF